MQRAQGRGRIRTLLGRVCRFHLWEPNQFGIHKPLPHDAALAEHDIRVSLKYIVRSIGDLIDGLLRQSDATTPGRDQSRRR